MGKPSEQLHETPTSQFPDTHPAEENADAEGRGGDHRETQDGGTFGKTSYQMGDPSGNKDFEKHFDPQSAYPDSSNPASQDVISNYGIVDGSEEAIPQEGNQLHYGIEGPAAGSGRDAHYRNTKG